MPTPPSRPTAPVDHSDEQGTRTADTPTGASQLLSLAGRTVLLASDGSPSALAGARLAQALATNYQAAIHVVSVVDTRSVAIPPPLSALFGTADAALGPSIHAEQEEEVRSALTRITGQVIDWPVRIMLGTPAAAIAQEAQRTDAALVIVGLRRHGRFALAMHDETALNVMRAASCPVLGVAEDARILPTRILAAMDFGKASVMATRVAPAVADRNATLVLAYVAPSSTLTRDDGEAEIHDMGVRAEFARVATELAHIGITFDHVVLRQAARQSVVDALLDYAEGVRCDLITAGSVRRRHLDRWLMGSVSTGLVRDGRYSVLVVPAAAVGRSDDPPSSG